MIERAGFGLGIEVLEALGHAGQVEFVEQIKRWVIVAGKSKQGL
jgi:hypothetical protein